MSLPPTPPRGWTDTLPVNEHFGPVIQGEGPYAGRRCSFIRFGGCNLNCPPCDTPQTWDTCRFDLAATCPPVPVHELITATAARDTPIVVLSGGEPLLWQRAPAWHLLLPGLLDDPHATLHVETNGTIAPTEFTADHVAHFSVSPKLTAMGGADPHRRRIKPRVLAAFAELAGEGRAALKVVCSTPDDVREAAAFATAHGFPRSQLWVMPEGATHEETTATARRIAGAVLDHGTHFSARLHLTMGVR